MIPNPLRLASRPGLTPPSTRDDRAPRQRYRTGRAHLRRCTNHRAQMAGTSPAMTRLSDRTPQDLDP
jgi:hypothetical protein